MLIPLRTDSPLRSTPWANWGLLAANVIFFIMQLKVHNGWDAGWELNPRDPHLANYLTYAFLHGGWAHLVGNMLALYIFGNNINDRLGQLGYLGFYLAGAVFAGAGFVLSSPGRPVIGASGAIGAVMGAYLALLPLSNITILYWFFFVGVIEVPSMYFVIIYFVYNIVMNISPGAGGVAYEAHIAGMVFGFAVGMGLLATRLLPRNQWDFLSLIQRWRRRRQYRSLVRGGYNPFAYDPARPPTAAADPNQERIAILRGQIAEHIAHRDLPAAARAFLSLKSLDPAQVLSRQNQLDVANQLASDQNYPAAADAYEQFLKHYPTFDQIEHVELMLGLIYARYLHRPDRARAVLQHALARLHTPREVEMAREELTRLGVG